MKIAVNVGTITLSRSHPGLSASTLRCIHVLDDLSDSPARPHPDADLIVAWDLCGSGQGSVVLLAEGPEAAQPFRPDVKPIDASIVAVLDEPLPAMSTDFKD
ncbi:MAG: EutN/CcmL family microcompartment protein [Planctomycetota bacterium]